MDGNHPIPQDVTGFQFKLIGNMTLKQFGYVAVGGILAVAFFHAPISILFKVPLVVLPALSGVIFAFVPYEGRPIDIMILNFIHALFLPSQYVFHKTGGILPIFSYSGGAQGTALNVLPKKGKEPAPTQKELDSLKKQQLQSYIQTIHQTNNPLDVSEDKFLGKLFTGPTPSTPASPSSPPVPQPAPQPVAKAQPEVVVAPPQPVLQTAPAQAANQIQPQEPEPPKTPEEKEAQLEIEAQALKEELDKSRTDETQTKDPASQQAVHAHSSELETQLNQVLGEKERLEKELQILKDQIAASKNLPQEPTPLTSNEKAAPKQEATNMQEAKPKEATVRKIPPELAKSIGLPHLPEVPNLIIGIVKDPRGNVLQNILVEVKDKDGTPARAFRTNSLGQFASATPLANGVYTVEFEDSKGHNKFDTVEIDAKGEILYPLEITSQDEREELRKALFS